MRYLVLLIVLFSCYATVNADPVTLIGDAFALHYQNGTGNFEDFLKTNLNEHPDIVAQQIFGPGNPDGFVDILVFLQGPAGTLFRSEWIYDGQLLGIDDFILPYDFGPDTALSTVHVFPLSYTARPVVLNLTFGGQTATYTFTVREPIPEPATLNLFTVGSIAVCCYAQRIRNAVSRRK